MKKFSFLYAALITVAILAVAHLIAEALYLYWTLWWFDYLTHFLGGFSLGFFSFYVFYESGLFGGRISLSKSILFSFILVMLLGGVWEVFEYANGLTQSAEEYSLDVVHDFLSDALGAITALWLSKLFL